MKKITRKQTKIFRIFTRDFQQRSMLIRVKPTTTLIAFDENFQMFTAYIAYIYGKLVGALYTIPCYYENRYRPFEFNPILYRCVQIIKMFNKLPEHSGKLISPKGFVVYS